MGYDEEWLEDEEEGYGEEEEYEEDVCPFGFTWDECCECVLRGGIEVCEFMCPFGGPFRRDCYDEKRCSKILEEAKKRR